MATSNVPIELEGLQLFRDTKKDKRVSNKTEHYKENEIDRLKKSRSALYGRVTTITNQITTLMENRDNGSAVIVKRSECENAFIKFKEADIKYLDALDEVDAEQEYSSWSLPHITEFEQFRSKLEAWLAENGHHGNMLDDDVDVKPEDSASQIGSGGSRQATNPGRAPSLTSSVISNSSLVEAEAKKAELLARMAAVREQQLLEEHESTVLMRQEIEKQREQERLKISAFENKRELEEIQKQKELLKIKAEIAEQNAKIKVYRQFDHVTTTSDSNISSYRTCIKEEQTSRNDCNNSAVQSIGNISCSSSSSSHSSCSERNLAMVTKLLIEHNRRAALPPQKIPAFTGDPLKYKSFIRAFKHGIESNTEDYDDRLYYLEQYTQGEPKEIVSSCIHMEPKAGYERARKLLEEDYGNPYIMAKAYTKQAENWPELKAEDKAAFKEFALFLNKCENAMQGELYLKELDHHRNIQMLVFKLPYQVRSRWRTRTYDILQNRPIQFKDFVEFVNRETKIITQEVFGDLNDKPLKEKGAKHNKGSGGKNHRTFAVSTKAENTSSAVKLKTAVTRGVKCLCCLEDTHEIQNCKVFADKSYQDKKQMVKIKGLCYGCLKNAKHIVKDCTNKLTCDKCGKKHPTILHYDESVKDNQDEQQVVDSTVRRVEAECQSIGSSEQQICKPVIIPVKVKCKATGLSVQTYAFIDNGCDTVFCTEEIRQQLNVGGKKTKVSLNTIIGSKTANSRIIKGLEVTDLQGTHTIKLPATYTPDRIPVSTDDITREDEIKGYSYLERVHLPSLDTGIGLLIGNNVPEAFEPWEVINSQGNGPFAVRTKLGWFINGSLTGAGDDDERSVKETLINRIQVGPAVDQQLTDYFNREYSERLIDDKLENSVEDNKFMKLVEDKTRYINGHYQVPLPFRNESVAMPNNKAAVEHRLNQLRKRFTRDGEYHAQYTAFMKDILNKGYAERVPTVELAGSKGKIWYLPHHGVFHPQKRKIRVVFDCSAEYRGTSLNNELMQGPDLTSSLFGVLIRFREERVALMSDVEAMFSQVHVTKADQDYQRFLWWPDGDIDGPPVEYRMKVHIFGATSSPSCANYALKKSADGTTEQCVKETIMKNFYVDDMLKAVPTVTEGKALAEGLIDTCRKGGFRLTKWVSNARPVMEAIPEEERAKEIKNLNLEQDNLPTEHALGTRWNVESDTLGFSNRVKEKPATRRGILGVVSSVYDPLGMAAPALLPPKIILQDLCKAKFGWDDEIPEKYRRQWETWLKDLPKLEENFAVPRCMKPENFGEVDVVQLHHFTDASESGYGAVSYLRLIDKNNNIHCAFLTAKARVAPLKKVSIPRMELTAATVAVRMDKLLRKEMKMTVNKSYFWTDSRTVLRYINNETSRFHTFVANRVTLIREATEPANWSYINTLDNPAYECSRGQTMEAFLNNERWLKGPNFLCTAQHTWPTQGCDTQLDLEDPEVKKNIIVHSISSTNTDQDPVHRLIEYYSCWYKLKKAVAWIRKLGEVLLKRCRTKVNELTVQDVKAAENAIIRYVQHEAFSGEIEMLKEKGNQTDRKKSRNSPIYRLDPFMGEDNLANVGGRLSLSMIPDESKYPVILPKNSHVSMLVLREIHERGKHFGRSYILSKLREKYWIPNANSAARIIVSKCVVCKRQRAKLGEQKMANLPADRLQANKPPFTSVGVDYWGPIEVIVKRSTVKRYGVIFTCMAIRAVHIEVADTLSTDSFINALRRFIARRGPVKIIRSDNGTNFVGANRILKEEINKMNQDKIKEALLQEDIEWKFNPPYGSHFGGVWERQIRTIRQLLQTMVKQQKLTDESLRTFLCEVEHTINSRPITASSDDARDLQALTPNMLLNMKGAALPISLVDKNDSCATQRWKQVQYLSDLFWKRWPKEYLPALQERQKWLKEKKNLEVGDVVLVKDENTSRNSWPLGRVIKVMPDRKGLVRRVLVKTRTSVLERPHDKLCTILEADS